MRLLDRYLLRELLIPLGYCLAGFLIFWVSFDLFSELEDFQAHKLRGGDVAQYYLVKSPEFLVIVLPIALLLALLYALTNHARHHELTAIRATGVSLWRLSVPYFGVGLVASAALFALNELCVPNSAGMAEHVLNSRSAAKTNSVNQWQTKLAFQNTRDGRSWLLDYNPETREMRNVHVDWLLADGSRRVLAAVSGARSNGMWVFFDVQEHTDVPGNILPVNRRSTNVLAMPDFSETPEQIKSEIKISNRFNTRLTKKPDLPLAEIFNYLRLHGTLSGTNASWLYTKLHGRLAAPWTCLVVVLIALPFGAASDRRNAFVGVACSILICFVYFVLLQFGLALGAGGYLPPWFAAWFPNLSFGIAGLWLTSRVR